ncbi:MAG: DUF4129 domain-containing protein [Herpetosiphon sp.]
MRKLILQATTFVWMIMLLEGLLAAATAAWDSFGPPIYLPGTLVVGLVITLEAMATEWIVVRERYSWSDQGKLRGLEAILIAVLLRLWVMIAEGQAILSQLVHWVRDPLAIFSPIFLSLAGLAFVVWGFATSLSREVLVQSIFRVPGTELGKATIERGHADAEQVEAVQRVDHLLFVVGGLSLLFGVIALRHQGHSPSMLLHYSGLAVGGSLAAVVAAFLLHSHAHLRLMAEGWYHDGASVDPDLVGGWHRLLLLVVIVLLISGPLLGAVALVAPTISIIPFINVLLVLLTALMAIALFVFAVALTPLAWLLSLIRGTPNPGVPPLPRLTPPQLPAPIERATPPLLPGIIFWLCVALLLGIATLAYLDQRRDLLTALPRWRVWQRLIRFFGLLSDDAVHWIAALRTRGSEQAAAKASLGGMARNRGVAGDLRRLYHELRKAGGSAGVVAGRATTPGEWKEQVGSTLPPAEPDVEAFTDTLVRALYSGRALEPREIYGGSRHGRRVLRLLRQRRRKAGRR